MGGLTKAIEREDWEVVAMYLILGTLKAIETLPPESVEAMMELLASAPNAPHPAYRPSKAAPRGRRGHRGLRRGN